MSSCGTLSPLSSDVICEIFCFLPVVDLSSCFNVCSQFSSSAEAVLAASPHLSERHFLAKVREWALLALAAFPIDSTDRKRLTGMRCLWDHRLPTMKRARLLLYCLHEIVEIISRSSLYTDIYNQQFNFAEHYEPDLVDLPTSFSLASRDSSTRRMYEELALVSEQMNRITALQNRAQYSEEELENELKSSKLFLQRYRDLEKRKESNAGPNKLLESFAFSCLQRAYYHMTFLSIEDRMLHHCFEALCYAIRDPKCKLAHLSLSSCHMFDEAEFELLIKSLASARSVTTLSITGAGWSAEKFKRVIESLSPTIKELYVHARVYRSKQTLSLAGADNFKLSLPPTVEVLKIAPQKTSLFDNPRTPFAPADKSDSDEPQGHRHATSSSSSFGFGTTRFGGISTAAAPRPRPQKYANLSLLLATAPRLRSLVLGKVSIDEALFNLLESTETLESFHLTLDLGADGIDWERFCKAFANNCTIKRLSLAFKSKIAGEPIVEKAQLVFDALLRNETVNKLTVMIYRATGDALALPLCRYLAARPRPLAKLTVALGSDISTHNVSPEDLEATQKVFVSVLTSLSSSEQQTKECSLLTKQHFMEGSKSLLDFMTANNIIIDFTRPNVEKDIIAKYLDATGQGKTLKGKSKASSIMQIKCDASLKTLVGMQDHITYEQFEAVLAANIDRSKRSAVAWKVPVAAHCPEVLALHNLHYEVTIEVCAQLRQHAGESRLKKLILQDNDALLISPHTGGPMYFKDTSFLYLCGYLEQNPSLTELSCAIRCNSGAFVALASSIMNNTNLKKITLREPHPSASTVATACYFLSQNKHLRCLDFADYGDKEFIHTWDDGLSNHPTVKHLTTSPPFGHGAHPLSLSQIPYLKRKHDLKYNYLAQVNNYNEDEDEDENMIDYGDDEISDTVKWPKAPSFAAVEKFRTATLAQQNSFGFFTHHPFVQSHKLEYSLREALRRGEFSFEGATNLLMMMMS